MGTGTGPIQANLNGRIFWDQARGKLVIKDEDGTQRLLASAESIKLSQSGFNVETATDSQLVFSSEFNLFKIVGSGELTVPQMSTTLFSTNTYTDSKSSSQINHNLSFTPAVIAFMGVGSTYTLMPFSFTSAGGTGGGIATYSWTVYSTDTYVQAFGYATEFGASWSGGTDANKSARSIKYYLLQETAS